MRTISVLSALLLIAQASAADEGAAYLLTSPTAEQKGGGSVNALSYGAQSVFYNPAGLLTTPYKASASMTQNKLYQDTSLSAAAVSFRPHRSVGVFALSYLSLDHGSFESLDDSGRPSGSISASDSSLALSWAQKFSAVQTGLTVKLLSQRIGGYSASGKAIDAGVQAPLGESALSLGVSVNNVGPKMSFLGERFDLPLSFNGGLSYALAGFLDLQAGLSHRPYSQKTSLPVGARISAGKHVLLRTGLANLRELVGPTESGGGTQALAKFSFGLGMAVPRTSFKFDYAFTPSGADLQATHWLTLSFGWGKLGREGVGPSSRLRRKAESEAVHLYWQ